MIRVKGFRESSMRDLEKEMNTWLEQNHSIEVMDMQYSYYRGVFDVYSALILYKKVK